MLDYTLSRIYMRNLNVAAIDLEILPLLLFFSPSKCRFETLKETKTNTLELKIWRRTPQRFLEKVMFNFFGFIYQSKVISLKRVIFPLPVIILEVFLSNGDIGYTIIRPSNKINIERMSVNKSESLWNSTKLGLVEKFPCSLFL